MRKMVVTAGHLADLEAQLRQARADAGRALEQCRRQAALLVLVGEALGTILGGGHSSDYLGLPPLHLGRLEVAVRIVLGTATDWGGLLRELGVEQGSAESDQVTAGAGSAGC